MDDRQRPHQQRPDHRRRVHRHGGARHGRAGRRDPRRRAIGHLGIALAFGFALLDHGLRDRPDQRLPHQPGDHARDVADPQEVDAAPRRVRLGRPRCSAASSARRSSTASPAAGTAASAAGSPSNGWDRDGFSGLGAAIVVEIVFTALFVFVVLSTTGRRFAPGFGGLAAGITLAVIHLVTIPVDNTSVNPARSLATAIFADTDPNALGQLWVFIVFPLIGSVVGVFVWLLVDEATLESTMLDTDMLRRTRDALDDVVDNAFERRDRRRDATEPGPQPGLRSEPGRSARARS